jgi:hypothetical protein
MARGLWATATSPPLIVTCFLAVLAMWAAFTAFLQVFTVSPAAMVWFLALPPIHSFLELQSLSAIGQSPILAVVFGGALVVVQAYLFGMWIALIDGALHGRPQDWSAAKDAARTAAGHLQTMIGIEAGFLALVVLIRVLDVLFVGLGLGLLGAIVAMSAGLYFLIFAPVAVIHDGLGVRDAVRASVRGARLPGSRHVVLTFGYVILALLVQSTSATTRVSPATPSILTWAYVLLVNFLNLTVLAAFVYRWLMIRPLLDVGPAGEPSAGRRPWFSGRPSAG